VGTHGPGSPGRLLHVAAVDFTAAKLLAPQLAALDRAGFLVRLTCGRSSEQLWSDLQAFQPAEIEFSRSLRPRQTLRAVLALVREVRAWRPDVLHLHTPAASLPVRLLPRWIWPKGLKIVYTVHGYLHAWPPRGATGHILQRLEQQLAKKTDLMLFQSAEDYEESRRRGYRSALSLLGNGVEDSWFEFPIRERKDGPLRVLYVGRLVREKGILDLVEAVARVPDIRLDIVGSGLPSDRDPVDQEVQRAVDRFRLRGRVHMHGELPKAAVGRAMKEADVLCLPSYREGVPRSVIEALAAGRPALVSDIRGCRELVTEGINGALFPAGDVEALAGKLKRLVAMAPVDLLSMARRARASVDPSRREAAVIRTLVNSYEVLGVKAWTP